MTTSPYHMQACMDTWLNCENLLISILQKEVSFSRRTKQVLDECANICLGTLQAIKTKHQHLKQVALLCVGICEECAETCERYNDTAFQTCAASCRRCSLAFSNIASTAL